MVTVNSTFALVLVSSLTAFTLIPTPPAVANVRAQLETLQNDQALKKLLSPTAADNAKRKTLTNLAQDLAKAGLVPTVELAMGRFDDTVEQGMARFQAPVSFTRSGQFATRIEAVAKALGASATGARTVCFTAPGSKTERFNVSAAGESTLLDVLGVSDIEAIPKHHAQMNGRVVVLSHAGFGEPFYDMIRARAEAGAKELSLSLSPLPEWQPVRLSLTTTEGQKVTIPVELDGADRKLEIGAETRWMVNGEATEVTFDESHMGQIVLLGELMRQGNLTLKGIKTADHFPVDKTAFKDSFNYSVHLVGSDGAWFASIEHNVQAMMAVQRTDGPCSLSIAFDAQDDGSIDLGWLPMETWNSVAKTKVIAAGSARPVIGYLTAPECVSNSGGLSGEEFDKVMELPTVCSALCTSVSSAAKTIAAVVDEDGAVLQDALPDQNLSMDVCTDTCVRRSAYRVCLEENVQGDPRSRYIGLMNCEDRRRVSE